MVARSAPNSGGAPSLLAHEPSGGDTQISDRDGGTEGRSLLGVPIANSIQLGPPLKQHHPCTFKILVLRRYWELNGPPQHGSIHRVCVLTIKHVSRWSRGR